MWAVGSIENVEIYTETTALQVIIFTTDSFGVACTFARHLTNVPS